jgi:arginyl-tRNA synthetase
MQKIEEIIALAAAKAVNEVFGKSIAYEQIQVQKTKKEFTGDLTVVVFPLTKLSGKSPEETGKLLGEFLVSHSPEITEFNVVKGFLNLVVADDYWFRALGFIQASPQFGFAMPNSLPRVLVEYSSPNTNKPLHLGHLRNIFLGYSVSAILEAAGHAVSRVQIINDRGIHICKSMLAYMTDDNPITPETSGLKGDKVVGHYYVQFDKRYKKEQEELKAAGQSDEEAAKNAPSILAAQDLLRKWEDGDPAVVELWKKMNQWVYDGFAVSYNRMGVRFDKNYYESQTYLIGKDEVLKGLDNASFFRKDDGSVWVDLQEDGLDQKALLRRDGTAMYITQDIGTAILRFQDFPDASYQIYTVGNEQEYHFKVLFKILAKLGWPQADKCYHLSYGMVELPHGRMKSREGTVVDADDIMDEMEVEAKEVAAAQGKLDGLSDEEKNKLYHIIGMSALKYFLLKVDPVKNMLFNPQESIDFNGNTGPFIQYTYVRTRAILRKAVEQGLESTLPQHLSGLHAAEKEMIKVLCDYPAVVSAAAQSYNPSLIANYAYEVARIFNSFYHELSILREENLESRALRICLTDSAGKIIASAMSLLGIAMADRM